ncbi:ABC transporter substrate-binding protein [Gordonia phthalatica]|uniref:ABC transporter substrate-binding protein n=1 Tax=Gordonia phthalatica TaxID=1136941 RepID=A0A0N9N6U0_9ACTN|nr:ABC transporter substrate-binding protein [Gordonia phthalatica]ALG83595.1 ABC transporter substrate-binding protein [Gordonia phthalatica]
MRAPRLKVLLATAAVLVPLVATGCSSSTSTDAGASRDCITDFDASKDYFPDKSTIEDATGFTIDYHRSYQVVTVAEPYPGAEPAKYVLVRCGAPTPKLTGDLAGAPTVQTPIRSMYSGSTTQLPSMAALDRVDVVTGVANADYVSNQQVRDRISEGKVRGYADGTTVKTEDVITGHPDVLVSAGFDDPAYAKIAKAGIPVLADADWLEQSPLGRAEWIKFFAALTGTEKKAADTYSGIKKGYLEVAEKVKGAPKVDVLQGSVFSGKWTRPGGASYSSNLVEAAGGTSPWADDTSTGSLELSLETVIARQSGATVWIINNADINTLKALFAEEPRYRAFTKATSNVWNSTKAVSPSGANDFWERGVLRPDLVLGDLAALIHPELYPSHQFVFYQRLS